MSMLAIKGHPTRGKEVIEILEMLGGMKKGKTLGTETFCAYYIDSDGSIDYKHYSRFDDAIQFTLEEFLEKFPYKIGDEVSSKYLKNYKIEKMEWEDTNNRVIYKLQGMGWYAVNELQPYKEETVRDNLVTEEDFNNTQEVEQEYMKLAENLLNQLAEGTHWKCKDFDSQKMLAMFLKKNTLMAAKKDDSIILDIPKGYEFAGFDDDKQQVVFTKIQPKYPKTYVECAKLLDCFGAAHIDGYKGELLDKFQELLICRDAYWKIAGEQMDLGKPWKPEKAEIVHAIFYNFYDDVIDVSVFNLYDNVILCFPTEEIRDKFFENFNDLINKCKELL